MDEWIEVDANYEECEYCAEGGCNPDYGYDPDFCELTNEDCCPEYQEGCPFAFRYRLI